MATSTAVHPAWMAKPIRMCCAWISRAGSINSGSGTTRAPTVPRIAVIRALWPRKLAQHYKSLPSLAVWHVSNEYGRRVLLRELRAGIPQWLRARFGSLDELNKRWE